MAVCPGGLRLRGSEKRALPDSCACGPRLNRGATTDLLNARRRVMQHDRGPKQTKSRPVVWADLDAANQPSWVVWNRLCGLRGADGQPCPRRLAGFYLGSPRCDQHWPADVILLVDQVIG